MCGDTRLCRYHASGVWCHEAAKALESAEFEQAPVSFGEIRDMWSWGKCPPPRPERGGAEAQIPPAGHDLGHAAGEGGRAGQTVRADFWGNVLVRRGSKDGVRRVRAEVCARVAKDVFGVLRRRLHRPPSSRKHIRDIEGEIPVGGMRNPADSLTKVSGLRPVGHLRSIFEGYIDARLGIERALSEASTTGWLDWTEREEEASQHARFGGVVVSKMPSIAKTQDDVVAPHHRREAQPQQHVVAFTSGSSCPG